MDFSSGNISPIKVSKDNYSKDDDNEKLKSNDDACSTTPIKAVAAVSSLRPSTSRSSAPSPYYNSWQLLKMNTDEDGNDQQDLSQHYRHSNNILNIDENNNNLKPAADMLLTRSAIPPCLTPMSTVDLLSATKTTVTTDSTDDNPAAMPTFSYSSSIYGTKNTKRSLEDDDPSDATANIMDHLNLSSSAASAKLPVYNNTNNSSTGTTSVASRNNSNLPLGGTLYNPNYEPTAATRLNLNVSPDRPSSSPVNTSTEIATTWPHSSTSSPLLSSIATETTTTTIKAPVRQENDEYYNYDDNHNDNNRDNKSNGTGNDACPVSAVTGGDDFTPLAKEHSRALMSAASSKSDSNDTNTSYIRELIEYCKKDQENLQGKLSTVLEEDAIATDHLEELFGVNDEICAAMEAGKDALKREKERKKLKKLVEGPTIELLEENKDVFSLICMLRAPNEKRMQAALALMKFAKDDQALSDEIISSGGIHSFLTLFHQTRSMTRELKVVASLAVAYILPSYVASSQTSSSIGLKLVECLHFLATSNPVSPNGVVITIEEMCKAASVGVNVLWVNSIQPLIQMKKMKNESSTSPPSLRPGKTVRYGRLRSRTGGGVFDQGHESIEIQELTELAVTLIAHLAKLTQTGKLKIDTGYNIVEQVCEVDEARPIAVREGLLAIFVEWIRSGVIDKVRPAASALRYLIAIQDKYMAGWIHSQVVNEGAVNEIVKLLNESVGQDVRLAVAEMLSYLCVAPHTRAAVVHANGVNYLVALLYEHSTPDSEDIVLFACTALLQLAAGAMTGASAECGDYKYSDNTTKHANVVNEILQGWAHGSFVQIALEHKGKLRSISVEALRVLSEDTDSYRQTRLQLCSVGAAETLGLTIRDNKSVIALLGGSDLLESNQTMDCSDIDGSLITGVKDTYRALRALANILEPQRQSKKSQSIRRMDPQLKPNELLVKGCLDVAMSGGLTGILCVSALSSTPSFLAESKMITLDRIDLVEESCRLLANLSPLLLSDTAASGGVGWAIDVFEAMDGILKRLNKCDDNIVTDMSTELNIDALQGIGALAVYEPLKIRIVNQTLPKLLLFKSMGGERIDIATAANQVLLSMGFIEDEISVQVAGNNPQFLVDLFCLQRALLLQAMARAEIRTKVLELWHIPLSETYPDNLEEMRLLRQKSQTHSEKSSSGDERSVDSQDDPVYKDLFENFTSDYDSRDNRAKILRQYLDVYKSSNRLKRGAGSVDQHVLGAGEDKNMMASHVFPLNDTREEKDWILSHYHALETCNELQKFSISGTMPERVEKLLDSCFPSKVLRNYIVPVNDLLPQSSFNFRAFMMPTRRYFSFRREGELLARLCDKQVSVIDPDDVHWTLGFTNSTFAGEFVESLVQTLYKHPMITGLSFVWNSEWIAMRDTENGSGTDDVGGLLANLTGSLPPWVSHLTFDNMLNDRDLRALVAILDTIGKLSSGHDFDDETSQVSIGQPQGNFECMSIRNSLQITRESWSSFFQMLGKMGHAQRNPAPAPLSTLKILDLTGNKLGDEAVAMVLELVHDKYSGCSIEQLDLTGNRIGRGTNVVRVLRAYTEYYRYNQKVGVKMLRKSWQSSLHTLILAGNDLFLGQAGLEIFALLKHNALCLRYLDLSNNGLESDSYQLLTSCLLKNTSLCHLNLSENKFNPALIDLIFENLNKRDAESGLPFLLFENNSPPLTANQRSKLAGFLQKSRKNAIKRYVVEREEKLLGDTIKTQDTVDRQSGELELIDEETKTIFSRNSFNGNQESLSLDTNNTSNQGDNKITVLFSAPLVFVDGENKLHPFEKLDFEMERELLWQCMKEASRDIEMSFDNAHHSRLLASLTRRCSVLHYSGHGHHSLLPFEDGMGGPNWLSVQDIKELILQDGVVPFKFVFVSACHSGLAGETFASAGVPHVVCCKQESELKDTAALAFTRSFYLALLMGHTVKESFDQGCKAVRATPNLSDSDEEMKKFVLLPKGGDHDKPVFRARSIREWPKQPRSQGSIITRSSRRRNSRGNFLTGGLALGTKNSELSVRNMMQEDPSPTPPQFFLGREMDLYYILSALLKLNKRLVSVLGDTGIGRSSLVCALCHYINERASTISEIQHIYFIKPKQGDRNVLCRSLLRQLLDKLEENGKCRPNDEDTDTEAMLEIICRSLKTDKCLIVFDRTELIKSSDVECLELPKILSTILYETKQVRVIITALNSLGQPAIGGQVEHSYCLGPFNFANTVKLFAKLCPHLHTPSERGMLSKKLVRDGGNQMDLFPGDSNLKQRTNSILSIIGDGIPAKIEKAAYNISKDALSLLQEL